eukprot:3269181-Amphidinium_carterae.2
MSTLGDVASMELHGGQRAGNSSCTRNANGMESGAMNCRPTYEGTGLVPVMQPIAVRPFPP